MEKISVEYSLGVLCKCKGNYLIHKGGGKIWRLAKGHYEIKDTYNVAPYAGLKVKILERHFDYEMEQGPALIIAGIREVAEETGYVLPCDYLRNILQERYKEQGKLKLVEGNEVSAAQQPPYKYFNSRKGLMIEKRLTFFLAELNDLQPVLKTKDKVKWVTKAELDQMITEDRFEKELVPVIEALEAADKPPIQ